MNDIAKLHFKKPGLLTLIEDGGRKGHQHYGVPQGGFLDKSSAQIANWLVGNALDSPVLEITMTGPDIEISGPCQMALTGADLSAKLNGTEVSMYETLSIEDNAILSFGELTSGCRCYMAIRGDWYVNQWLGSTGASANLPLPKDSTVSKNQILSIKTKKALKKRICPESHRPAYESSTYIRVMQGPEFEHFPPSFREQFFTMPHTISNDSNRMGYRLGKIISDNNLSTDIISSGIVPGTIQITNNGEPIILMADAQTTGGYKRIANVIENDLDKLAQAKPGNEIKFLLIPLKEALDIALKNRLRMNELMKR